MIIAGIGCRRHAASAAVLGAIDAAFLRARLPKENLRAIATGEIKRDEAGIAAAARALGVPLLVVSAAALEATNGRTLSYSARSLLVAGTPSLAEAAALAAGGPNARLLWARIALRGVTCALVDEGT